MIAVLIAIFVIVGLPLIYLLAQYNALVSLRNYIRESWSNVDVELKAATTSFRTSSPRSRATPRTNARCWSA